MIRRLWSHLSTRRQRQFLLMQMLIIVGSFLEMLSLGAVLPFLTALSEPEYLFEFEYLQIFSNAHNIRDAQNFVLPFTVIFVALILFSAIFRGLILWAMTRLSFTAGADLSVSMYQQTLHQDYEIHVSRNSSEVINGIITKTKTVTSGVIYPMLNLISSLVTIIGIMVVLLGVNVVITLVAFLGFGGLYMLVMIATRGVLNRNSHLIAEKSDLMVKSLQEGLGGVRDVLINNTQEFYTQLYKNSDLAMRRASWRNEIVASIPKFGMEAIGITAIALFAYASTRTLQGLDQVLPTLGVFVLGAQKLLPLFQKAYASYSRIKASKYSLLDVLVLLDQPRLIDNNPSKISALSFRESIELSGLSFRYADNSPWVLKDLDLTIPKGTVLGIVGITGCGKSTLVDILMGLLMPTCGEMRVDGELITHENRKPWQQLISSVPQNIYLTDSTLEENIAFGCASTEIDHERVKLAAQLAQISAVIEAWSDGYDTVVGERGLRISGGQRQRVGIARAFYRQSEIIFLDEATSALDDHTEKAVMSAIRSLDKETTIIIIAHRITTLKNCDQILRLGENNHAEVITYKELLGTV